MKRYKATLKTIGPVHIGNGEIKNKSQYAYDQKRATVSMIDNNKFVKWLIKSNLLDTYEKSYLSKKNKNLFNWIFENNKVAELPRFTQYTISARSISSSKKALNDIQICLKDPQGSPYVPGSTLKGALRNALFCYHKKEGEWVDYPKFLEKFDKHSKFNRDTIRSFEKEGKECEKNFFIPKKDDNIMKYLLISDSALLPKEKITLVQKIDEQTSGKENNISTYREAIAPGTEITFEIKIKDEFGYTIEEVEEAIKKLYQDIDYDFLSFFNTTEREGTYIYIGGGSGYASKTATYPLSSDKEGLGLSLTSKILDQKFPKDRIGHIKDKKNGVSPRTLKVTKINNNKYEMGLCKITFEEIT